MKIYHFILIKYAVFLYLHTVIVQKLIRYSLGEINN